MEETKNMSAMFGALNDILKNTNLTDVTAESNSFSELPDGYYLSELESAKLKESKSSHQPMVALEFKVVEDGIGTNDEGTLIELSKTKNRKIFLYYVLKDESTVKRFVTDMLKFEGDKENEPLLGKEYFSNAELIEDALDILIGRRVYIQSSTTMNDDDSTSVWKNMISWKRARDLGFVE